MRLNFVCMMANIVDGPKIQFIDVAVEFLEAMRSRLPIRLQGPGRRCHTYVQPPTSRDDDYYFKSPADEQKVKKLLGEMNRQLVPVNTIELSF